MTTPEQPQYAGYSPTAQPVAPTNSFAIVALICSFVVPPVGLVFGIIAQHQIARTGEQGAGLALAAIILSAVFTGLIVMMVLAWVGWMLSILSAFFSATTF
ncbi:uncharacterized protein DUF4190 [Microcella alkaliphila]|uniref:Uncharacterized protein DUF4190 n=1 Tax=Microcella alkaliphila TaxID=279828 RepID=A0A4Q7TPY8_9MICO|nr:DUF4190 domain-containing protein [Microcella alkaliphila]RZT62357.1 uncharacterized protein DUF4190 [Microcella alkaliphila]